MYITYYIYMLVQMCMILFTSRHAFLLSRKRQPAMPVQPHEMRRTGTKGQVATLLPVAQLSASS